MKAVEVIGNIDEQHRVHAHVPSDIPVGKVRLIVFLPAEDEAGDRPADAMASEWCAELSDPRDDIYTLADGQPVAKPSLLSVVATLKPIDEDLPSVDRAPGGTANAEPPNPRSE